MVLSVHMAHVLSTKSETPNIPSIHRIIELQNQKGTGGHLVQPLLNARSVMKYEMTTSLAGGFPVSASLQFPSIGSSFFPLEQRGASLCLKTLQTFEGSYHIFSSTYILQGKSTQFFQQFCIGLVFQTAHHQQQPVRWHNCSPGFPIPHVLLVTKRRSSKAAEQQKAQGGAGTAAEPDKQCHPASHYCSQSWLTTSGYNPVCQCPS